MANSDTPHWNVPSLWEGQTCWIIGGGLSAPRQFGVSEEIIEKVVNREYPPSVLSDYFSSIQGEYVIGVNNAYMIGVWIDMLFFGDCSWYLVHKKKLINWPGVKVTCCPRFANKRKDQAEGIKFLQKDDSKKYGISEYKNRVSWNSNSGAAAISLAVHLGVRRIILLGFDMALSKGNGNREISHWHGSHRQPNEKQKSPPFKRHLKGFPAIKRDADERGIEILNASPISEIKEFPKVTVEEILNEK